MSTLSTAVGDDQPGNTLFLRLAGPLQSWGTTSKLQIRRSDPYPSKSGVLGLLLAAMGVARADAESRLPELAQLRMGVRADREGTPCWDYHTAGAGIGIRTAEGKIKRTASTDELETLLSRRQYLCDASFLVALCGDGTVVARCARALRDPVWPVFLGRKSCVPSEPVFAGIGDFSDPATALASQPWAMASYPHEDAAGDRVRLRALLEHPSGTAPPPEAMIVNDVPRTLLNPSHGARWVVPAELMVPMGPAAAPTAAARGRPRVDYRSDQWRTARRSRLEHDRGLCVFCKSPATEVHHVSYARVGRETNDDLRSLCDLCHDACTQLEYGRDQTLHRVDPADPSQRAEVLSQVKRLVSDRRLSRRRELLATRSSDYFGDTAGGGIG